MRLLNEIIKHSKRNTQAQAQAQAQAHEQHILCK